MRRFGGVFVLAAMLVGYGATLASAAEPVRIGILGFNDIAMAAWAAYRLTTIRQPIGDIITAAVDMIAQMVAEGTADHASRRFGCTLVERGTLRAARG